MSTSRYRPLSDALANVADEPLSKRQEWEKESKKKSDESGHSYDEPIVHVEAFRATTLDTDRLPSNFSTVKLSSTEEEDAWKACQQEAIYIVQDHKVQASTIGIVNVSTDDDTDRSPVIYIYVPSTRDKGEWKSLIISICRMLHAKDCLKLGVLIQAPDPRPQISYYSIKANDPLVSLWPKLREPVLRVIDKMSWNIIGLVRAGETDDTAVPTIVICTKDDSSLQWPSIETSLKAICRGYGTGDLKTMVISSTSSMFAVSKETPCGVPVQQAHHNLEMGQSIGVDERGSGTLGGHLRLVFPDGHSEILGLTNYHVVRPDHATVIKSQREIKNGAWDAAYDNGTKHFDSRSPYSTVQAPSIKDHADHCAAIQQQLEKTRKGLNEKALWKAKIDAGMASNLEKRMYRDLDEAKARFDTEFSQWCASHKMSAAHFESIINSGEGKQPVEVKKWISAHRDDILYGTVKYSSGKRTTSAPTGLGQRLDWALIKPVSGMGVNQLPSESDLTPAFKFRGKTRVHGFAETGELKQGLDRFYFKIGRTTGLTVGKFNTIDPWVNMEMPPNSENPNGGKWVATAEYTMINRETPDKTAFSGKGDSGAWVINQDGMLMGMIWGDKTLPDLYSYFTPIETLLRDIKMRTGCLRVELS